MPFKPAPFTPLYILWRNFKVKPGTLSRDILLLCTALKNAHETIDDLTTKLERHDKLPADGTSVAPEVEISDDSLEGGGPDREMDFGELPPKSNPGDRVNRRKTT